MPHGPCAWSLGQGSLAEMSQLPLPESSLCLCLRKVQELPHPPASPVGDLSCAWWYSGEQPHFSVWIWVQVLLAKLITSCATSSGTCTMSMMFCIHYMNNTAFLCKRQGTFVFLKPSHSSPQDQILPRSVTLLVSVTTLPL